VQRKASFLGQVLHDGIELKYLAVNVELRRDVDSFEEVVAE
jgi:hypothetical protein